MDIYKRVVVKEDTIEEEDIETVVKFLRSIDQSIETKEERYGGFNYFFIKEEGIGKEKIILLDSIAEFSCGGIYQETAIIKVDSYTNKPILIYLVDTEGIDLKTHDFTVYKGVVSDKKLNIDSRDVTTFENFDEFL